MLLFDIKPCTPIHYSIGIYLLGSDFMSDYAVIQTGGRQYRVEPGDVLDVEKISVETGEQVELNDILLINENDEILLGSPNIQGASVLAVVKSQHRGPKIIIFKYKNKTHYRRKNGHRQDYTRLEIQEIRSGVTTKKRATRASASAEKTPSKRTRASASTEKTPTKRKRVSKSDSNDEQISEEINESEV